MLNKIIDGIAMKLDQEFGFEIHKEAIKQGLDEPCFFILLITSNQKQLIGKRYFGEQPFDIHYFPSTENKNTECLDIVDRLNDILQYVTVDSDLIRGSKMHHEIIDGVLHFFVDYNLHIYKEPDAVDSMDILTTVSGLKEE